MRTSFTSGVKSCCPPHIPLQFCNEHKVLVGQDPRVLPLSSSLRFSYGWDWVKSRFDTFSWLGIKDNTELTLQNRKSRICFKGSVVDGGEVRWLSCRIAPFSVIFTNNSFCLRIQWVNLLTPGCSTRPSHSIYQTEEEAAGSVASVRSLSANLVWKPFLVVLYDGRSVFVNYLQNKSQPATST